MRFYHGYYDNNSIVAAMRIGLNSYALQREGLKMTLRTPIQTRSKLPDVGTTIFTVIGQLSAQHNAINLSQGAPNAMVLPCAIVLFCNLELDMIGSV
jgi:hypothetical protein